MLKNYPELVNGFLNSFLFIFFSFLKYFNILDNIFHILCSHANKTFQVSVFPS